jgi:hypothetical protein
LRVMTLKRDPPRWIGNIIRSNRRMVGNLLDDECRRPTFVRVWPVTVEKSAGRNVGLRYVIRSSHPRVDVMTYSPSTGLRGLVMVNGPSVYKEVARHTSFQSPSFHYGRYIGP